MNTICGINNASTPVDRLDHLALLAARLDQIRALCISAATAARPQGHPDEWPVAQVADFAASVLAIVYGEEPRS